MAVVVVQVVMQVVMVLVVVQVVVVLVVVIIQQLVPAQWVKARTVVGDQILMVV